MAKRDESGASLVEFALILPVFMMLLLGMLTGGLAYSRKLSIAQATREGARYGATLPISATMPVDSWLDKVAALTVASSDGELGPTRPGQTVCVAFVPAAGQPKRRQQVGTALPTKTFERCIASDGRDGENRVQVVTTRSSTIEALVFSQDVELRSHAVARFEP